jgi:radical SAM superfamily enzyme YgiQ (UPF0313 family)
MKENNTIKIITKRDNRKKLLLINPNNSYKSGIYHTEDFSVPPMSLGVLAALTPSNWDIEILDENVDSFRFIEADLIGLTAFTSSINRAYEIANYYRKRGLPIIMGGIHVSMMPIEASRFADAVVIGEAESIWQTVIEDFENSSLKQFYHGKLQSIYDSPPQRLDLYNTKYGLGSLQTSRGCPMNCDFCSVHEFNGRKYRYRPIEDIIKEFKAIPQDRLYIIDDDFYGYGKKHIERTKEICKGFIKCNLNKQWYTFTSMNLAKDKEALDLMYKSGCRMVLLGIETEIPEQLIASDKQTNLKIGIDNYETSYRSFHEAGIAVLGSFIYGLESDTVESIKSRTDYFINSSIDCIQPGMLTPLPGTRVFKKLQSENRIFKNNYPKDWEQYTFFNNTIIRDKITDIEFTKLMHEEWNRMFDIKVLKRKYLQTLKNTKSPTAAGWALSTNLKYHNTVTEGRKDNYDYNKIFKQLTSMTLPHK